MSWSEAMKAYDVSRGSISKILYIALERRAKEPDYVATLKKKRGRKTPLTFEILTFVMDKLERDSQLTLKAMTRMIEEEKDVITSPEALSKALQKLDITWKNVLPILECWNDPNIIEQRMHYIQELTNIIHVQNRNIVYIDETGFNLHTIKKTKGRAVAGEKAMLTLVPKGQRITIIACIGRIGDGGGYIYTKKIDSQGEKKRGTNADDFRSFLLDLAPKLPRNTTIIMDNCRIHKAENLDALYKMLRETYNIKVMFLPPYSPFLNPIEYSFNDLKMAVAEETFYDRAGLSAAISQKIPLITAEKFDGYLRQSRKYYQQCLIGMPFHGKPLDPDIFEGTNSSASSSASSQVPQITEV